MRITPVITLSPQQRTVLESQVRSRSLPVRVVERARIVLFAAAGQQDKEIAANMAITPKKASRWRKRQSMRGYSSRSLDNICNPEFQKGLHKGISNGIRVLELSRAPASVGLFEGFNGAFVLKRPKR